MEEVNPLHVKTNQELSHFFRHEYARVLSYLLSKYSTENIELIEDALQDAMVKAMNTWSFSEIPKKPTAWIVKVAQNRLIDLLRRNQKVVKNDISLTNELLSENDKTGEVKFEEEIEDSQLKMIFACCDPILSEQQQIIITLKLMCGFSKYEIGKSLLQSPDTISKAFTRAKEKLKKNSFQLFTPSASMVTKRLDVVVKVIYLLFNEGYKSSSGNVLIREDLCIESMRLSLLLIGNQYYNLPKVNALMALICFQASRFPTRQTKEGLLILLENQDRSLWDKSLIENGIFYLNAASNGNQISDYHVQASIAACHCTAKNYESTDWKRILELYEYQIKINPNPVTMLNRIVAISKVHGVHKALDRLEELKTEPKVIGYYLFHLIKGSLLLEIKSFKNALTSLQQANVLIDNAIEKKYINALIDKCNVKLNTFQNLSS